MLSPKTSWDGTWDVPARVSIDDWLEALEHIPTPSLKFEQSSQKVPGELLWSLVSGPGLIDI